MTGALLGTRRDALPYDLLEANAAADMVPEALKGLFPEEQLQSLFAPKEELAEFLYGLAQTMQGRELIEWLLDISIRPTYRVMGQTIEETALWAAKREGMCIPGEMVLAAIARGHKSILARKPGATQ
jgi:hypothetical protein